MVNGPLENMSTEDIKEIKATLRFLRKLAKTDKIGELHSIVMALISIAEGGGYKNLDREQLDRWERSLQEVLRADFVKSLEEAYKSNGGIELIEKALNLND